MARYHRPNLNSPVVDRPLMCFRQMFASRICRIDFTQALFFFNRLLTDTRFLHRYSMKRKGEWVEISGGTSLPRSPSLSPAALPSLLRILYRAIRPRRGPDKQEPLDWKQLWGIRKVCVPGLGSGTRACVYQQIYTCTGVCVCVCMCW